MIEGTESTASTGSASRCPAVAVAAAAAAAGRGRPLITSSMLNDALRHVRPTASPEQAGMTPTSCSHEDSVASSESVDRRSPATGGRRLKARPVTMASALSGGTTPFAGTGSGDQDRLTRRTRDVTDDAE